jgi:uncharacterized protein
MGQHPSLLPVQPDERIQLLDVLRGFALFGILLVNMDYFIHPLQTILIPLPETVTGIERAVAWFVKFIAEGKFYSIFSFLFGYGFTMMMMRAETHQTKFLPIISRRYFVLFLIGLVHAFFFWVGDILALYSLLGFVLILFRNAKPKTLIIWVIVLLVIPLLFTLFGAAAIELGKSFPESRQEIEKSFAQQEAMYKKDIDRAYEVYPTGSFFEITKQRAYDMIFMSFSTLFIGPSVFAMFLVGMYFGKRQILQYLASHIPLFKKIFWWGLIIGVIGNFTYASLILSIPRFEPTFILFTASFGQSAGAPALSLCFISAFALAFHSAQNKRWLHYLAAPGRMALSTYLLQSIICTTIFYGYGFGLFGQVGKVTALILTIVIYGVQIIIMNLWMKKFQYGPAEWLWRWLTYLKKPTMTK